MQISKGRCFELPGDGVVVVRRKFGGAAADRTRCWLTSPEFFFFPSLPHFVSFVRLLAAVMRRCISTCTLWRHELHLKYSRVECVYIPIFQSFYVYSSLKVYGFLRVPAFLRATVAVADDWDLNGGWHCTHVVSCHLCTTGPCTDTFFFFCRIQFYFFQRFTDSSQCYTCG